MSCHTSVARQHFPILFVLAVLLFLVRPLCAAPPEVFWPGDEQPLGHGHLAPAASGEVLLARMQGGTLSDDPRMVRRALDTLRQQSGPRNAHSWWLQGRMEQRLHEYANARASLARASALAPDNLQYLVEQFYVALAMGHAEQAQAYCQQFTALKAALLAASCSAQWELQFGDPQRALGSIQRALSNATERPSALAIQDARITRADILSRLGKEAAVEAWLQVLAADPQDRYARDQLVRQLLVQQRYQNVERLTRGYDEPGLMVSRLIALRALEDRRAVALYESLQREFRVAAWRGDGLHRNEHVRFLAQVEGDRHAALTLARDGWEKNPTPENRRLLVSLASAMGDDELMGLLNGDAQAIAETDRETQL